MKRRILLSLLIIALVVAATATGALALFTDQETSAANAFTTGNFYMELRYAISTTADGASILDEQLDLTIDVVTDPGVDTVWYTDDDVVGIADIYGPDGQLSTAAIGNPTSGAQAGDRTLAASGNERLRFKVILPLSTDNSYINTGCTVAFVFDAEQTVNNP
jgi:predicted ribosomally synthesized peptide with SipW-like signal peptide